VVGNYAYVVSSYDDSLTIIDVTNPAFPTLKGSIVGTVNYLGDPYSVFVLDDYAYVAAFDDNSLTIIDVTNPALPTFMGNILGGTEVLKYQPNTIISGTTLPDIDLTQDGIITFGVGAGTPPGNPPGVIVVPGPIKPISDARCNLCSASSQTFITTTPPEPSGMYDEGSTAGIPGANLVNDAIANAGIATDGLGVVHTEVFWYPLAFLIAIVLGFGAYGLTKEIIVQAAVSGIVMACFAGGGVLGTGLLPWFTVLIFAIEAVLFVIIKARQEV
jgi:hypothetical protein